MTPKQLLNLAFFNLLSGNYLASSVRDGLTYHSGKDSAPFLVALTALMSLFSSNLLILSPNLSEILKVGFLISLWGFTLLLSSFIDLESSNNATMFFIISGLSTILTSSFLWGLVNSKELNMKNEFSNLSKSASLGQIVGSFLGWIFIELFNHPRVLLFVSSIQVLFASYLLFCLNDQISNDNIRQKEITQMEEEVKNQLIAKRKTYIFTISVFQLFNCMTTSLVYLLKLEAISQTTDSTSSTIASFSSKINILAAICILFIQFSGFIRLIPSNIALLTLPSITGCALLVHKFYFRSWSSLIMMVVLTRVASYALTKPFREALFVNLSTKDRIRSKPLVDAFICKIGTIMGAGFHSLAPSVEFYIALLLMWFVITFSLTSRWEMMNDITIKKKMS